MRIPPCLSEGDTIAIAAPARKISMEELQPALRFIEDQGFKIKVDNTVFKQFHQFAGTDAERAYHFQNLLDDPEVKAILCARGGYGAMRMIGGLDFSKFILNPKWIIGYSDITVIHARILQSGIESLHATMPINFNRNTPETLQSLLDVLQNKPVHYTIGNHLLNRTGIATGQLAGGNLSILYSLAGSSDFPDMRGKILFIEDLDEYLYHIDRMILSLKRMGVFEQLSGLIVGGMEDMRDNAIPFGKNAEEIIAEHIEEYDFPVCFGFPSGHLPDNRALVLGRNYQLKVIDKVEFDEIE